MEILETAIPEVKIVVPKVFGDARGYFFESWNAGKYTEAGIDCKWMQDNESRSRFGVLRGLHYQAAPYTQAKLVRVIEGAVLDVAVDIRKGSPTFGKHVAVELTAENKYQLFVPRGFAHGFLVLTDTAEFCYKCDDFYHADDEGGLAWNDPEIGIRWPELADGTTLKLSEKDRSWRGLRDTFAY